MGNAQSHLFESGREVVLLIPSVVCSLNQPVDIVTYDPTFQPWRDLENEVLNIFDRNSYFTVVTPDDLMSEDEDNLASAIIKEDFT